MRRWVFLLGFVLLTVSAVHAAEVKGVVLAPDAVVQGETLRLNGYGTRTKFFFDIYIGSLYAAHPLASLDQALLDPSAKLIRMNFLYKKVEREKIVEAFAEGIANNSPQMTGTEEVKRFLSWFDRDFIRGDQVDLSLGADGMVTARQNGDLLGELNSRELAQAVLGIYLGKIPADERLKEGMLAGGRH